MYIKPYQLRDNVMVILVTNTNVDGSIEPLHIVYISKKCWLYEVEDIIKYSGKMVSMGAEKSSSNPPFTCYYEESISLTKTAINASLKKNDTDLSIQLYDGDIVLIHDKIPKIKFKQHTKKEIDAIISNDKKYRKQHKKNIGDIKSGKKTVVVRRKNNIN